MKVPAQLILIATYRCNLACSHCPVTRSNKSLSAATARKAVLYYLRFFRPNPARIKICGGEPFLNFSVIREVIRISKRKSKRCKFSISTNGTLINSEIFAYLKRHPEVEIWYSPHSEVGIRLKCPLSQLPNIGINILISPRNVNRLSEIFLKFLTEGYRKFNFLPAYFTPWEGSHVHMLEYEFSILAAMIKNFIKRGMGIRIKNLTTSGSTPLFNDGFVVDHNGDVFQNNLVLSQHFSHLKPDLKVGNISHVEKLRWERDIDYSELPRKHLRSQICRSTMNVDKALSDFVAALY